MAEVACASTMAAAIDPKQTGRHLDVNSQQAMPFDGVRTFKFRHSGRADYMTKQCQHSHKLKNSLESEQQPNAMRGFRVK